MRVFITGASGYIGQSVAKAFRLFGHHVKGLIRKTSDAIYLQQHEIEPVMGLLDQPHNYLPHIMDAQVIVHCAFENSAHGVKIDALVINACIEAAQSISPRIWIYTSGCWVYGSGTYFDESSALNPISLVKWRPAHEKKVLEKLSGIVVRPGFVFGGKGSLTNLWFESCDRQKPLVAGDGNQSWPMIHVDDLALLYVKAAEHELQSTIFNASAGSYTINECMHAIVSALNISTPISYLSDEESKAQYGALAEGLLINQTHLSNEKAKRLLNWTPTHPTFIQDVMTYYEAWKSQVNQS